MNDLDRDRRGIEHRERRTKCRSGGIHEQGAHALAAANQGIVHGLVQFDRRLCNVGQSTAKRFISMRNKRAQGRRQIVRGSGSFDGGFLRGKSAAIGTDIRVCRDRTARRIQVAPDRSIA